MFCNPNIFLDDDLVGQRAVALLGKYSPELRANSRETVDLSPASSLGTVGKLSKFVAPIRLIRDFEFLNQLFFCLPKDPL